MDINRINNRFNATCGVLKRGFTIVELLVVVVVIGILAAITIISYTNISSQARDALRLSDLESISRALSIVQVSGNSLGSPNTVYISLPDT